MATNLVLAVLVVVLMAAQVATAAHWGEFAKSNCQRAGFRKWYSRLWDIQGDWNTVCMQTPATVNNFYFPSPDSCVNKGVGGMWGEFYVPDSTCTSPLWTAVRKAESCSSTNPGFAKFVAKLEVVEAGKSSAAWASYVLCMGKEATIEGVHFDRPDRCVVKGEEVGTFGEFYIRNLDCDGTAIQQVV